MATHPTIKGYSPNSRNRKAFNLVDRKREETVVADIGGVYGRLTVIEHLGYVNDGKHTESLYGCLCSCGRKVAVAKTKLCIGGTKSCGCLRMKPHGESARNSILIQYKRAAKYRDLCWGLDDEEAFFMFSDSCYYCGCLPSLKRNPSRNSRSGSFLFNGIDRLDNSRGYASDNCVSCCKTCNIAKKARHANDFIAWAKRIAANNPKFVF